MAGLVWSLVLLWPVAGAAAGPERAPAAPAPPGWEQAAASAGPAPPVAPAPPAPGWEQAEALVVRHLRKTHAQVEIAERLERWRYVFWAYVDDREHRFEIVVAGKRFKARGNRGLRRYLAATGALSDRQAPLPAAADVVALLGALGAYPPVSKKRGLEPDAFVAPSDEPAALRPALERGPKGGWRLTLNYLVESSPPRRRGSPAGPTVRQVERWHLAVPPDYQLRWTREDATYP
jgi:hypothetical protein